MIVPLVDLVKIWLNSAWPRNELAWILFHFLARISQDQ